MEIVIMHELAGTESHPQSGVRPTATLPRKWFKLLVTGNPFYLASAGLLLCGINQLTTDPRLVGAEYSMLIFNSCALGIYEIMLTVTAIALARRNVWYEVLLLVGLANVFIIVPFSLISRAVYLSTELAGVMCAGGFLIAIAKFWAFRRFIPRLNLPDRLMCFGAVILAANAVAPLLFKTVANDPAQSADWVAAIWLFVLPVLAGFALFLPRPIDCGDAPAQKRWLPLAFYAGWIAVTACHFGGIGYSISFDWNLPLLGPLALVVAWTLYLRRRDICPNPSRSGEQLLSSVPLLIPMLSSADNSILQVLVSLNVTCYALRLVFKTRSRAALIQFLTSVAISLACLPAEWLDQVAPGMPRIAWLFVSITLCFSWRAFLSIDPRTGLVAALSLIASGMVPGGQFAQWAVQVGLISLLAHSVRWQDHRHKGAATLRLLTGLIWVMLCSSWLRESTYDARLTVYSCASVLTTWYGVNVVIHRSREPWVVPACVVAVFALEPGRLIAGSLSDTSPGFATIAGSFLLFAAGSVMAFAKARKPRPELNAMSERLS